jgi:hypothetical protein
MRGSSDAPRPAPLLNPPIKSLREGDYEIGELG